MLLIWNPTTPLNISPVDFFSCTTSIWNRIDSVMSDWKAFLKNVLSNCRRERMKLNPLFKWQKRTWMFSIRPACLWREMKRVTTVGPHARTLTGEKLKSYFKKHFSSRDFFSRKSTILFIYKLVQYTPNSISDS